MAKRKSTLVLNEMAVEPIKDLEEEPEVVKEVLNIPKRCDWIRKEKGTTCFTLKLCLYCRATEKIQEA